MHSRSTWFLLVAGGLLLGQAPATAQSPAVVGQNEPRGFQEIELGMEMDVVKQQLLDNPYFAYRGDPDVSFVPASEQSLIACRGNSYIEWAYFQFHERRLFIIILVLDTAMIDFFSTFQTLSDKYGEPALLDPGQVVWEFASTRFSIEKPLSLKYVDAPVFEMLKESDKAQDELREVSRRRFLDEL